MKVTMMRLLDYKKGMEFPSNLFDYMMTNSITEEMIGEDQRKPILVDGPAFLLPHGFFQLTASGCRINDEADRFLDDNQCKAHIELRELHGYHYPCLAFDDMEDTILFRLRFC